MFHPLPVLEGMCGGGEERLEGANPSKYDNPL